MTDQTGDGLGNLIRDSAVYVSTARSVRNGGVPTAAFTSVWDDYSPAQAVKFRGDVPTTHFPPGYAATLAAVSIVDGSIRGAARALDIALIAINLVLIGWLTARMTACRSMVVPSVPVFLLIFTSDIRGSYDLWGWLTVHLSVASEPLFMALYGAGLLAIARALSSKGSRTALFATTAAASGALIVRYVGVALLLTAVVAFVAFDRQREITVRLRRSAVVAGIAITPTLLFLGWGVLRGGTSARTTSFHWLSGNLKLFLDIFGRVTFPIGWSYAPRTIALIVLTAFVVAGSVMRPARVARHWENGEGYVLVQLALVSIFMYVIVLVITRTFFDARTPIDARLLSPVRGIWYAVVVAVVYRTIAPYAGRLGAVALVSAMAAIVITSGWAQQVTPLRERLIRPPTRTGVDATLSRLPRDALVFSTDPDVVYTLTGRSALALPARRTFTTGATNHAYRDQIAQLVRILNTRGGYLDLRSLYSPIAPPRELDRLVRLRLIAHDARGTTNHQLYEIVRAER